MDDVSARAAGEKVRFVISENPFFIRPQADAIRVKVGFPISPDTRDPKSIAQYYSNVKIDKNKFFENILSAAYCRDSICCQHLLIN